MAKPRFMPERRREGEKERARELPARRSAFRRVIIGGFTSISDADAPRHGEESGRGYSADLTQFHREDSLKDTA